MKLFQSKYIIFFILIIQLSVLILFGCYKKGMHFDECFSYFNTNNSVGRQAYDRSFVSSEDIMKDFYVKEGEQFNYSYVVLLQSYDVHPPVFYIFLHTLCSLMPGIYSIWQGVALNILYSLLTTFVLFLIMHELTGEYSISAVISFAVSINPGTVNNVMYIRMYCLMTLWIVICIYLHILMSKIKDFNKLPWYFYVLNAILTFLGFLTHYFYLVFLFFIEAGFIIWRFFDKNEGNYKTRFFGVLKYSLVILISGILGVAAYPSCLGHVNSGYRGVEVKSYLFDLSDFGDRFAFFNQFIDKYVFNGWMYLFLVIAVLCMLAMFYVSRKKGRKIEKTKVFMICIFIPTLGYYLVSVKSSLVGDEAMMRYQLPIYPLILLIFFWITYVSLKTSFENRKTGVIIFLVLSFFFVILNIYSLGNKRVYYLYEEQKEMEETAYEYKDEVCVYIYNTEEQKYRLWNDFAQLSEFKEVYFVNSQNTDPICEPVINEAEKLFVYVSTLGENDNFDVYSDLIFKNNDWVCAYSKVYDAMYATAYEFY